MFGLGNHCCASARVQRRNPQSLRRAPECPSCEVRYPCVAAARRDAIVVATSKAAQIVPAQRIPISVTGRPMQQDIQSGLNYLSKVIGEAPHALVAAIVLALAAAIGLSIHGTIVRLLR